VRSPPLQGVPSAKWVALRGKPGDKAEAGFLGGMHSARPKIRAGSKPGHLIVTCGSAKGPWPKRGNVAVGVMASLPGVRSPPLRGGPSRGEMALRGKPGDNARGDFLGGARSPRPRGKALLMPRHNIIIEGKRTPGGQMGHAPARPIPSERACGARPSRGCQAQSGSPCVENPETRRRPVFSEGCTVRVRKERPDMNQGMS